jgi:hypothetical protein
MISHALLRDGLISTEYFHINSMLSYRFLGVADVPHAWLVIQKTEQSKSLVAFALL